MRLLQPQFEPAVGAQKQAALVVAAREDALLPIRDGVATNPAFHEHRLVRGDLLAARAGTGEAAAEPAVGGDLEARREFEDSALVAVVAERVGRRRCLVHRPLLRLEFLGRHRFESAGRGFRQIVGIDRKECLVLFLLRHGSLETGAAADLGGTEVQQERGLRVALVLAPPGLAVAVGGRIRHHRHRVHGSEHGGRQDREGVAHTHQRVPLPSPAVAVASHSRLNLATDI